MVPLNGAPSRYDRGLALRRFTWQDARGHANCAANLHDNFEPPPFSAFNVASVPLFPVDKLSANDATIYRKHGWWHEMTNPNGKKSIDEVIRADKISMTDLSSEWLVYLCTIDEPVADLRTAKLVRMRSILDRAVLLRACDRIDAETTDASGVTVDYVVCDRGDNISRLESYYNGQCLRVIFNKDNNDFVDAYFSLDLANAMLGSAEAP